MRSKKGKAGQRKKNVSNIFAIQCERNLNIFLSLGLFRWLPLLLVVFPILCKNFAIFHTAERFNSLYNNAKAVVPLIKDVDADIGYCACKGPEHSEIGIALAQYSDVVCVRNSFRTVEFSNVGDGCTCFVYTQHTFESIDFVVLDCFLFVFFSLFGLDDGR